MVGCDSYLVIVWAIHFPPDEGGDMISLTKYFAANICEAVRLVIIDGYKDDAMVRQRAWPTSHPLPTEVLIDVGQSVRAVVVAVSR